MPHAAPPEVNQVSRFLNKPIAVALIAGVLGYSATLAKDTVIVSSRLLAIEEWAADHRRNSITRDEFNRLDREVQQRATREEVQALAKRIDDMRADVSDIKRAVVPAK